MEVGIDLTGSHGMILGLSVCLSICLCVTLFVQCFYCMSVSYVKLLQHASK